MDMMIILTYTALCTVVFKVFKIPLNKWTVPTAALGGAIVLAVLMFVMNYMHPYAKYGREFFLSVPIIAEVNSLVAEVPVEPGQKVKKGDPLVILEDQEYFLKVREMEANLEDVVNAAAQDNEALATAKSRIDKARADRDRNWETYQRFRDGWEKDPENSPFTEQEVSSRLRLYEASQATMEAAEAEGRRIWLESESKIEGIDTDVARAMAQLGKARLDLERTIIRAPSDGMVAQIAVTPGQRAVRFNFGPVMGFIPERERLFAARIWQNSLQRLKPGLDAEVILAGVPGHIFKGKVRRIVPAMSEGEVQASGRQLSANLLPAHGFTIAVIELEESLDDYNLPLGVQGKAAIYNYEGDILHTAVVRKIFLRMFGWLNYLWPIK